MNQSILEWYTTHNVDGLREAYIVPPRLAGGKKKKTDIDTRAFSLELYLHIDKVPGLSSMRCLPTLITFCIDQEADGKSRRA